MALFVMEEPHVGPTLVTLILSAGVVVDVVVGDVVVVVGRRSRSRSRLGRRRGGRLRRRRGRGRRWRLGRVGGRQRRASAFSTFVVDRRLLFRRQVVQVRLDVERLLAPAAEQLHCGVNQTSAVQGIRRLRLRDPWSGDRPLRPALELDPEVEAAPQNDGDDPEHDDGRRNAEPDLALAHEVEAGLASIQPGDRAVTPPRLGEEGTGGVIQADQFLLVETAGVDALFQALDVLFGDVVERGAVLVAWALAVPAAVAHEPPPVAAPTGTPVAAPSPPAGAPAGVCAARHRGRWRC